MYPTATHGEFGDDMVREQRERQYENAAAISHRHLALFARYAVDFGAISR